MLKSMTPLLFRCPSTGMMVQGFHADDAASENNENSYIGVRCLACNRMHLINPRTGKVLGADQR
jgi:hypothetical protein